MRTKLANLLHLKPGEVLRPIEEASFAGGNGGMTFGIYERIGTPSPTDGEVFRSYYLFQNVDHFGATGAAVISLGTTTITDWLVQALTRCRPTIQAAESDYTRDFYRGPRVKYTNGEEVPPVQENVQTDSSDNLEKTLTARVLARHAARCSWSK